MPSTMRRPVGLLQAKPAISSSPGAHNYIWILARYGMIAQQNRAGSRLLCSVVGLLLLVHTSGHNSMHSSCLVSSCC